MNVEWHVFMGHGVGLCGGIMFFLCVLLSRYTSRYSARRASPLHPCGGRGIVRPWAVLSSLSYYIIAKRGRQTFDVKFMKHRVPTAEMETQELDIKPTLSDRTTKWGTAAKA